MASSPALICLLILAYGAVATPVSVNVRATLLHPEIEAGAATSQSVMFDLAVPEKLSAASLEEPDVSRDLVIVLDTSGSMRGEKLETAKLALENIIETSDPGRDGLHLITYSSQALRRTEGRATQAELLEILGGGRKRSTGIQAGGGTNLYAGLEEAEELLKSLAMKDTLKRVFLFSDGLVNVGVTNQQEILDKVSRLLQWGASTSAFGIGMDYDHKLMSAIAEVGEGKFFFIKDGSDMGKVVEVATGGFRNLFATSAKLRITALAGTEVARVLPNHPRSTEAEVHVGDLRSGEARQILVELNLPKLPVGTSSALLYELVYSLSPRMEERTQGGVVKVVAVPPGSRVEAANPIVSNFRRLQLLLAREEEVEAQVNSGDLGVARQMEDTLEAELADLVSACASELSQSSICQRASIAHARTQRSKRLFVEAKGDANLMSRAYSFKRRLNYELSEGEDEL